MKNLQYFLAAFMGLTACSSAQKDTPTESPQQKHQQLQPGQKLPIHSLFHLKRTDSSYRGRH